MRALKEASQYDQEPSAWIGENIFSDLFGCCLWNWRYQKHKMAAGKNETQLS
jgi:hypothetical protein